MNGMIIQRWMGDFQIIHERSGLTIIGGLSAQEAERIVDEIEKRWPGEMLKSMAELQQANDITKQCSKTLMELRSFILQAHN